jgi:hypothetical protein
MAPPTSPGFYPHSEWAAPGPVHVGVRSKPRPIIVVMDLGCWALPSNRRSLKDPPLMRSHPNKAVDVRFPSNLKETAVAWRIKIWALGGHPNGPPHRIPRQQLLGLSSKMRRDPEAHKLRR